ncbi:MAG: Soluble lytic murein transglycosylase [Pseudomonadota bacterium]
MPDYPIKAPRFFDFSLRGNAHRVLLGLVLTSGCMHTGASSTSTRTDSNAAAEDKANAKAARSARLADTLIQVLPESTANSEKFLNSEHAEKLSLMTGRSPTPQDLKALVALRALLVAQREIRDSRPLQARELAKLVLSTEHLSTNLYAWALRYLAMSDVLTQPTINVASDAENPARTPTTEFNALQGLQCAAACKTFGWQILSQEDPNLFSPNGYRQRLIGESAFKAEGLQQPTWLKNLFANSTTKQKKDKFEEPDSKKQESPQQRIARLRAFVENRQWNLASSYAKKVLGLSIQNPSGRSNNCKSDSLFAQYTLAQATRIAQDRRQFALLQDNFIRELDQSRCTAEAFGFDKEQFESFKLDARLWLARLQWEQNKNPEAFFSARRVIAEAATAQSWEHFVDAAHVLIGRVGFEMLQPAESLSFISALEKMYPNTESEDFQVWIHSRRGLLQFLDGNFASAKDSFDRVIQLTSDSSTRAMAFYWMGRSLQAARNSVDGENAFLSAGMTDPLGIYDIFSGQLLGRESGKASTQTKQAFYFDWRTELTDWLELDHSKQLRIVASVPPRAIVASRNDENSRVSRTSQLQFDLSLESSILFLSLLKANLLDLTTEEFSRVLRESDELLPSLLRAEAQQLRNSFQRLNSLHSEVLPRAHQVAWLTHMLGDHSNAILFVGRLRETLGWDTDYLPFLYFIFYPRPYQQSFEAAAQRCSVDIDLLYAVSRQESLYQPAVKSPVGAVGLMQLLPTTASRVLKEMPEFSNSKKIDLTAPEVNTLAGACYLKQLLNRYNNNLTFAIAAYNAGEAAVDTWVNRRQKLVDMPFFIEFIPYAETKTYVQRVLRNYYNIKWIYRNQDVKPSD